MTQTSCLALFKFAWPEILIVSCRWLCSLRVCQDCSERCCLARWRLVSSGSCAPANRLFSRTGRLWIGVMFPKHCRVNKTPISFLTIKMAKEELLVTCGSMVPSGSRVWSFHFLFKRGETLLTGTCSITGMFYSWLWTRYRLGSLIIINLQIALNVLLRFLRNDWS